MAGLARVGPIRNQADSIMRLLRSPRTAVHLVTVLEEMPVQETLDGDRGAAAAELPVGAVDRELRPPSTLPSATSTRPRPVTCPPRQVAAGSTRRASSPATPSSRPARRGRASTRSACSSRPPSASSSDKLDRPVELPVVPDGIDLGSLYELA